MFPSPQRNINVTECSPGIHSDRYSPPFLPSVHKYYPKNLVDADKENDYEYDGRMLIAVVASLCMVFLLSLTVYYVYFRCYANRFTQAEGRPPRRVRNSEARRFSWRAADDFFFTSPIEGLRKTMVDALPVFVYKAGGFDDGLRCAVCLCEFEENEKGRMLSSCNHSFHVDCIDMWFYSHSTCPLCRATVDAPQSEQYHVESDRRQMEIAVIQEKEESRDKKFVSSTGSGSAAAEAAADIP